MLVRVEEVYAVLRSKRPMRPASDVALALLTRLFGPIGHRRNVSRGTSSYFRKRAGVLRRTGDGRPRRGSKDRHHRSTEDPGSRAHLVHPRRRCLADAARREAEGRENKIASRSLRLSRG